MKVLNGLVLFLMASSVCSAMKSVDLQEKLGGSNSLQSAMFGLRGKLGDFVIKLGALKDDLGYAEKGLSKQFSSFKKRKSYVIDLITSMKKKKPSAEIEALEKAVRGIKMPDSGDIFQELDAQQEEVGKWADRSDYFGEEFKKGPASLLAMAQSKGAAVELRKIAKGGDDVNVAGNELALEILKRRTKAWLDKARLIAADKISKSREEAKKKALEQKVAIIEQLQRLNEKLAGIEQSEAAVISSKAIGAVTTKLSADDIKLDDEIASFDAAIGLDAIKVASGKFEEAAVVLDKKLAVFEKVITDFSERIDKAKKESPESAKIKGWAAALTAAAPTLDFSKASLTETSIGNLPPVDADKIVAIIAAANDGTASQTQQISFTALMGDLALALSIALN